jgi:hypothetical protein
MAWFVARLLDSIERMSVCMTVTFPPTLCSMSRTIHSVRVTVALMSSRLSETALSSDASWLEFCCTWTPKSLRACSVARDPVSSVSMAVLMASIPSLCERSDFLSRPHVCKQLYHS